MTQKTGDNNQKKRLEDSLSFGDNQRKRLEDVFFLKEEQRLIGKLRAMQKMQETKENLSKVSGIQDEIILQKLVDLDIKPEIVATLSIIPLVEVAWADGAVDAKEKEAVLKTAEKIGFRKGEIDYDLLEEWLIRKPNAEMLEAWIHYVQALCDQLSEKEKIALRKDLIGHAHTVASATGGFLGFGKVSKEEQHLLKKLEEAFVSCK
jgi:hypothetical protein